MQHSKYVLTAKIANGLATYEATIGLTWTELLEIQTLTHDPVAAARDEGINPRIRHVVWNSNLDAALRRHYQTRFRSISSIHRVFDASISALKLARCTS